MAAWGCPYDIDGVCQKVSAAKCDPGMRGCTLEGKVRFALDEHNVPRKPVKAKPGKPKAAASTNRRRLFF